jgi:hypothetical protein
VIAAGAVPLALSALVIELRMTQWSLGARFVVVGLIAALLLTMGWLAPLENAAPRAYHSVLLVAGLLPLLLALELLGSLLGAHRPPGAGAQFWIFGLQALAAAACARRANSGVCTLIAALAAVVCVEGFVGWVFQPHGPGTFRAILVLMLLAFAAGTLRLRETARRHAVALVDAAGLATLLLALTFIAQTFVAAALTRTIAGGAPDAAFGWKLYLLAVGLGLVAYAAVDREPGPGYIGTAVLVAFALLVGFPASGRGTLIGWPLFLLIIGGVGLVIGLRPREPLPPPPGSAPPAPTVPLRGTRDEGHP